MWPVSVRPNRFTQGKVRTAYAQAALNAAAPRQGPPHGPPQGAQDSSWLTETILATSCGLSSV